MEACLGSGSGDSKEAGEAQLTVMEVKSGRKSS